MDSILTIVALCQTRLSLVNTDIYRNVNILPIYSLNIATNFPLYVKSGYQGHQDYSELSGGNFLVIYMWNKTNY